MFSRNYLALGTLFFLFCQSISSAQDVQPMDFVLEFDGGTLTEYIQLVQTKPNLNNEGKHEMLNLVVMPTAANIHIPKIKIITNSTGAIGLLNGYKCGSATLVVEPDPSGNLRRIRAEYSEPFGVIVVNCNQLLNAEDAVADLIEAIEFGLEMSNTKVEVKLHKKTGLLFAKGPSTATSLVVQTVQQFAHARGVKLPGSNDRFPTWKQIEVEPKNELVSPSNDSKLKR